MKIKIFFSFCLIFLFASCMISNKTKTSNKLKDVKQVVDLSLVKEEKQKLFNLENPILVFSLILLSVCLINLLLMQISKPRKKTKSQ